MLASVSLCVTIDHKAIRSWAKLRKGRPATLAGEEREWPLLFEFDTPDPDTLEIDWRRFFDEFERRYLAFVYCSAEGGALDDSYELVHRSSVPDLAAFSCTTIVARVV